MLVGGHNGKRRWTGHLVNRFYSDKILFPLMDLHWPPPAGSLATSMCGITTEEKSFNLVLNAFFALVREERIKIVTRDLMEIAIVLKATLKEVSVAENCKEKFFFVQPGHWKNWHKKGFSISLFPAKEWEVMKKSFCFRHQYLLLIFESFSLEPWCKDMQDAKKNASAWRCIKCIKQIASLVVGRLFMLHFSVFFISKKINLDCNLTVR